MAHLFQSALKFSSRNDADTFLIHTSNQNYFQKLIEKDCENYFYQGVITLGGAIKLSQIKSYSWSVVLAYYSLFYLCRSVLACGGFGVFYFRSSPYRLNIRSGQCPQRAGGTTHEVVLKYYWDVFRGTPLVDNELDQCPAWSWFSALRNDANYRQGNFEDPDRPVFFDRVQNNDIRKMINHYVKDEDMIYTFDVDHAVFAYPLSFMREAARYLRDSGRISLLTGNELAYAQEVFSDRHGPIALISDIVSN